MRNPLWAKFIRWRSPIKILIKYSILLFGSKKRKCLIQDEYLANITPCTQCCVYKSLGPRSSLVSSLVGITMKEHSFLVLWTFLLKVIFFCFKDYWCLANSKFYNVSPFFFGQNWTNLTIIRHFLLTIWLVTSQVEIAMLGPS